MAFCSALRMSRSLLIVCLAPSLLFAAEATPDRLSIEPAESLLDGCRDWAQLIATEQLRDGTLRDLTHQGIWTSSNPAIVSVGPGGRIEPRGDGQAEVILRSGSEEAKALVRVRNSAAARPIQFVHEVLPALTKVGCNQGACHGTPTGKNGFRLSLRGYNPSLDYLTLARENGTRRSNPLAPETSLILLKGTGLTPHEGGKRMAVNSVCYRVLRDWVSEGVRPDPKEVPALTALVVTPSSRLLDDPAREQQLVVRATFTDGSSRDVTRLARYGSTDTAIASVDDDGRVVKRKRGETTVLVSFENLVATSRIIFREPVPGLVWTDPAENNFVDKHVFAKLKLLRISPSELSSDAMFAGRVHLDLIGLVPTPEEAVAFLEDRRPDKRARLIDALLKRPEYVDFWTLKWADRLGCNQRFTGIKERSAFIVGSATRLPATCRLTSSCAIVTAKGSNYTNPPASFYRRVRTPEDAVETVSQVFMGVRVDALSAITMWRNGGRRMTTTGWPRSSAR